MDGVHDVGGWHCFGPVPIETDAPLFRERWQGRIWALQAVIRKSTTIDRFRFTIEQMPAASYLVSGYYERWLWATEHLAAEQGILDSDQRPPPTQLPAAATTTWAGQFDPGAMVRVRNAVTAEHTRVPRYLRGHAGRVERVAFAWPNPGRSAATGKYGPSELVYTVAFAASDLFDPSADHTLTADIGESDLENL